MRSIFLKQHLLISLLLFATVAYIPSSHSQDVRAAAMSQDCPLTSH